jgi:hypothetical protein
MEYEAMRNVLGYELDIFPNGKKLMESTGARKRTATGSGGVQADF